MAGKLDQYDGNWRHIAVGKRDGYIAQADVYVVGAGEQFDKVHRVEGKLTSEFMPFADLVAHLTGACVRMLALSGDRIRLFAGHRYLAAT